MQIKVKKKYHIITVRITKIKKAGVGEDMEKWKPHTLLVERYNCTGAWENRLTVPQTFKQRVT